MVDAFACTNSVLFPVASSELAKAAEASSDVLKLFSDLQEISREQLRRELEQTIEKLNRNEESDQPKRERPGQP